MSLPQVQWCWCLVTITKYMWCSHHDGSTCHVITFTWMYVIYCRGHSNAVTSMLSCRPLVIVCFPKENCPVVSKPAEPKLGTWEMKPVSLMLTTWLIKCWLVCHNVGQQSECGLAPYPQYTWRLTSGSCTHIYVAVFVNVYVHMCLGLE